MERTIAVVAQNNPGVVSRLSGLMDRRGFQVKGMGIGATQKADRARFTFIIGGDGQRASQAVRQLRKIVDTVEVEDLSGKKYVERCLMLMKFALPEEPEGRSAAKKQLGDAMSNYSHSILEESESALILEAMGKRSEMDECLEGVRSLGLIEAVKSGPLALGA